MDREEMQKQIDELKGKIIELDNKLNNKMEKGQYYYYVDYTDVMVKCKQYYANEWDSNARMYGNVYPYTEEGEKQAKRELFEFKLMQKLKKFARENVCVNGNNKRYGIYYENEKIRTYNVLSGYLYLEVYFSSEEVAQKAIEEYKEDLLRYFTEEQ